MDFISKFEEFQNALLEFVKRAAKEGATAEEIAVLPAVAKVLSEIIS